MRKTLVLLAALGLSVVGQASWYWPFGSDEGETTSKRPRLSVLMEPASLLIDEATDLAEDGKSTEAVEKYREALKALDAIETEYRELADKPEFATLRNKRAYVNATIDSLLLKQVRENARAVAVSDTTELEKKLAAEKAGKKAEAKGEGEEKKAPPRETKAKPSRDAVPPPSAAGDETPARSKSQGSAVPSKARTRREQAMADLAAGEFDSAALVIAEMLEANPDDVAALNLNAVLATCRGDFKAAEAALDHAIRVRPRSYFAYYNMAKAILQLQPANKAGARRYYQTGRDVGGPLDEKLEARLK